ncbi:MAG: SIMPL domain-containing protein [Treponemataceae bacterium]|nr:SIMPL domain-containing protein [Treponemataceae bacterium]
MKKIALCFFILLAASFLAFSQGNKATISVSGSGSVRVPADAARLTFSVITKDPSALLSVQNNASKMNKVYDALKKLGIDEKSISTSNYSLYQENIYKDGKSEPGDYVTSNDIVVVLDDSDKAGMVIDTAISAGVNRMNGISFFVKDSKSALDEARILAFQQAKDKALLYAKEAGRKLGKVISIVEDGGYYPATRESMDMKVMATSNTTMISAGTDDISASVSVVFELE